MTPQLCPLDSGPALLQALTGAQEEDVVGAVQARDAMHCHALVAGLWLQQ